jgi:ZIP family zinc transporter
MGVALGWGALAASSLVIGALLGLVREWPERLVGLVLAFGAGALISAVAFELAQEGARIGGATAMAIGLAVGALTYYLADGVIERLDSRGDPAPDAAAEAGPALALGAVLDGIPEQLVLGLGVAAGSGISVGLLAAVFVSNLPEAVGSASEMREAGHSPARIRLIWLGVAVLCALATVTGNALADVTSGPLNGAVNGFAAGATLVMLIDSMIPTAAERGGRAAGLIAMLGFAAGTALSAF